MAKNLIVYFYFLLLPLIACANALSPLAYAQSQVGVSETSPNCGPEIEQYLALVNLPCGYKWCSAFVSACFIQAGYEYPRSAWSPDLFKQGKIVKQGTRVNSKILPQQVFGLYYQSLGRIAHTGIIEHVNGNMVITIEGNTNAMGSREGDGVYRKIRSLAQLHIITDYG